MFLLEGALPQNLFAVGKQKMAGCNVYRGGRGCMQKQNLSYIGILYLLNA